MQNAKYIPEEIKDKILEAANLMDIVSDFLVTKSSGSSQVADCPICSAKKAMSIHPEKEIFKCFKCDTKGGSALQFLMKTQGMDYVQALNWLADRYSIEIEQKKHSAKAKKNSKAVRNLSFRDQQMKESGLTKRDFTMMVKTGAIETETERYQIGTMDKYGEFDASGTDMVLNYLTLERTLLFYKKPKGGKAPYIRVRYANPNGHRDKKGNPIKYRSPYESGQQLWIPNKIINDYQKATIIETLYICEGEKKADKLTKEGIPAVAIGGIHGFALEDNMIKSFEKIIKNCGVSKVVLLLDADWNDISLKPGKAVDARPWTFFYAVKKFQEYFDGYNPDVYINTYFGYHMDKQYKGIDDLMAGKFKNKGSEIKDDLIKAMTDREGKGDHLCIHNISSINSDYKLKDFWHLNNTAKFIQVHKEKLKKLGEFTLAKIKRRFNEHGEVEIAQKLMPHEKYWSAKLMTTRNGQEYEKYAWSYKGMYDFLRNRGFGLQEYSPENYRFVHAEDKILKIVSNVKIQHFMRDFTREIAETDELLELFYRGATQYLSNDKLNQMFDLNVDIMEPQEDAQYLYFKNEYWKITADEIERRPLRDLPKYIWSDSVIDFEPEAFDGPLIEWEHENDQFMPKDGCTDAFNDSEIYQFIINTSNFYHNKEDVTIDEKKNILQHVACKMIALGYVLHSYKNYAMSKAIVCMDGMESEIGVSSGGTGKSLWSKIIANVVPSVFLDGKKKDLFKDNFLYEQVNDRTKAIVFDDVRVNFDFEQLFSALTTQITVNKKGVPSYTLDPIPMIINTNHALRGEGNSFDRRQYMLSFSDYYNADRTPYTEFGHQLFTDWDFKQWNLFYNFIASCIQTYLRFSNLEKYKISDIDLNKRKLRQLVGENLIEFFTDTLCGENINLRFPKHDLYNDFKREYPADVKYVNTRQFRKKLIKFAVYSGYKFNPHKDGKHDKSNNTEYYCLGDENFDINRMDRNRNFPFGFDK